MMIYMEIILTNIECEMVCGPYEVIILKKTPTYEFYKLNVSSEVYAWCLLFATILDLDSKLGIFLDLQM